MVVFFLLLFYLIAIVVIVLILLMTGALIGGGVGATIGGARGAMSAPRGSREVRFWRGSVLGGCLGVVLGFAAAVGFLWLCFSGNL